MNATLERQLAQVFDNPRMVAPSSALVVGLEVVGTDTEDIGGETIITVFNCRSVDSVIPNDTFWEGQRMQGERPRMTPGQDHDLDAPVFVVSDLGERDVSEMCGYFLFTERRPKVGELIQVEVRYRWGLQKSAMGHGVRGVYLVQR